MWSNLQFPADLVTFTEEILKGWYTYDVHFEGCGVGWGGRWGRQKKGVIGRRGDMTRHHAEPNISMLLTRNLPFDLDVRQWSYPLMIPLPCLWAKSNNRTRMSIWMWHDLVLFLFWFHSFLCTVRLLFRSLFMFSSCANKTGWLQNELQIKDISWYFLATAHTRV